MDELGFHKMHSLGNDFVILDRRSGKLSLDIGQIQRIADRRHGVGCDQLLSLEPSQRADLFMRVYNPDGSEAQACGNGTRCVARLLMEETLTNRVRIETRADVLAVTAGLQGYTVDMGRPRAGWDEIPLAQPMDTLALDLAHGPLASPVAVNMGNPACGVLRRRRRGDRDRAARPRAGASPSVPGARQHRRGRGAGPAHDPAAGVGARRRPDHWPAAAVPVRPWSPPPGAISPTGLPTCCSTAAP